MRPCLRVSVGMRGCVLLVLCLCVVHLPGTCVRVYVLQVRVWVSVSACVRLCVRAAGHGKTL